jgi:hypothetical protein
MNKRTNLIIVCRVDLTLLLLPTIGWREPAWTLAANDVPLEVAARVLASLLKRRTIDLSLRFGVLIADPEKLPEARHKSSQQVKHIPTLRDRGGAISC